MAEGHVCHTAGKVTLDHRAEAKHDPVQLTGLVGPREVSAQGGLQVTMQTLNQFIHLRVVG